MTCSEQPSATSPVQWELCSRSTILSHAELLLNDRPSEFWPSYVSRTSIRPWPILVLWMMAVLSGSATLSRSSWSLPRSRSAKRESGTVWETETRGDFDFVASQGADCPPATSASVPKPSHCRPLDVKESNQNLQKPGPQATSTHVHHHHHHHHRENRVRATTGGGGGSGGRREEGGGVSCSRITVMQQAQPDSRPYSAFCSRSTRMVAHELHGDW